MLKCSTLEFFIDRIIYRRTVEFHSKEEVEMEGRKNKKKERR